MKLTLLMPGLSWLDAHDGAEVCRGLALPALSTLLGRGTLHTAPSTLSQLYQQSLGAPGESVADQLARRARLSAGHWLLADPVHVRIDRDRALLADVGVMSIAQHEADALLLSLNQHFAEDGLQFHAPQPGRWLLQLPDASRATFTPLPDAVGENVNEHLPGGERGLHWSRLLNEMQMLLYIHPLNEAREARGELPVNSVWLWGDAIEAGSVAAAAERPDIVLADDELLQLQAATAGLPCDAAPYACDGLLAAAGKSEHVLLVQDALLAAAQYRDAWGWREQLLRMEQDWFAPLLQLLKQGRLQQLRLLCHGPAGFELTVSRAALWKFWQRPHALAAVY